MANNYFFAWLTRKMRLALKMNEMTTVISMLIETMSCLWILETTSQPTHIIKSQPKYMNHDLQIKEDFNNFFVSIIEFLGNAQKMNERVHIYFVQSH